MIEKIKKIVDGKTSEDDIYDDIIKAVNEVGRGMIKIVRPGSGTPSNGAWEVVAAAGKGYGKEIYGLGYSMSPNHMLMPDRNSVSDDAYSSWKRQFDSRRPRMKIDNVYAPQTSDKSDDGFVHNEKGAEFLDYSYEGGGDESMSALITKHESMLDTFADLIKLWYPKNPRAAADRYMHSAANDLFNRTPRSKKRKIT